MNKKSKVILLPCNSYREELVYENLETGLELLGSLESIVGKEESVLLKPCLLYTSSSTPTPKNMADRER